MERHLAEILVFCILMIMIIYGGFTYMSRPRGEIKKNREDLKKERLRKAG